MVNICVKFNEYIHRGLVAIALNGRKTRMMESWKPTIIKNWCFANSGDNQSAIVFIQY